MFIGVETEAELPELFRKLVKANKKEERALIQNLLRTRVTHPNSYGDEPPIVTPSLAKMIIEFDFAPEDQDDLSQGLQPFAINNDNAEQRSASLLNANKFNLLEAGLVGLQLHDLEMLLAKAVRHIPVTYMKMETTLKMFGDLVNVMLGATHPILEEFLHFWNECMSVKK